MKINEAEELLGISKANIRFYEKEGLLTPRRGENRYRDYSEEDLDRLREIVILRKLGISVQGIKQILDGELLLGDAMTANIANLEEQISQLTGALKLSRQIREEKLTKLDTPRYWEIIHAEESGGFKFADIMSDYWHSAMEPVFRILFGCLEMKSLRAMFLKALGFVVFLALMERIFWPDDYTPMTILEYPILFLCVYVLCLPFYLLQRKLPGLWGFLLGALFWVAVALIFLFFAILLY